MTKTESFAKQILLLIFTCSVFGCLTNSGTEAPEKSAISLNITSPTSATKMDTTDTVVRLAGNATSGAGIAQVTWSNDRGGKGIASGSATWQIGDIALKLGVNRITVAATDNAGAKTSRSIAIFRESGQPGTATLFWIAPTARTDGSPLFNLAGYKISYGRMSGIYDYEININNPGVVAYVIENLASGDWYFVLSAYDSDGLESERSNEVLRIIS